MILVYADATVYMGLFVLLASPRGSGWVPTRWIGAADCRVQIPTGGDREVGADDMKEVVIWIQGFMRVMF